MFNSQIPFELQPEAQAISRQQKMAELLMAKGMQATPGQTVAGGVYVPTNPMENIANLFNAYAGSKGLENVEQQQLQMAKAIREGKTAEQQAIVEKINKGDIAGALLMPDVYGGTKPYQETLIKRALPETPTSVEEFKYALQNPQFAQYQVGLKKAGAPSMQMVMGKSIAEQVGPMMKEAQASALAAVKAEDSAKRIIQAIDTNKIYTGTGANVRLGAAQVANTLGVGGNTLEEKIGNTRQAMQGLAQLTLEGRKQMRGEGQITNQESQLAERAISGDISFTPTEIKQLANAAKRASDYTYGTYQAKLGEMAKNPDTAGLVPYYQVPRMNQQVGLPNQAAIDAEIARRQRK